VEFSVLMEFDPLDPTGTCPVVTVPLWGCADLGSCCARGSWLGISGAPNCARREGQDARMQVIHKARLVLIIRFPWVRCQ
jgi:hypothetical protein